MSKKKLVPKLRFKEFDEKYKLKKVEKEFSLIKNYSYSRNDEGKGEYHHVHYGDIHSRYTVYIDQKVSVPSVKTTNEHIELNYGDIIVADASEDYADLGKSTVLLDQGNRKYIAGLHTFALRAQDNTNPLYFVYYSKTEQYKQYMSKIGTGTSVYGITRNNLQNMKYLAPSIDEQQKIGSFFRKIDEMIQLQQSKVNKVKDIKSAYLSEMFPKEGEKYPKKRFEGFTEPWIELKLDKIAPLRGGYSFLSNQFKKEGIPIVRISNILTDETVGGEFAYYQEQENDKDYILSPGSVVIAMSGATTGKVATINTNKEKMYQNQRVGYFRKTSYVNYSFLSVLVKSPLFSKQLNDVLVTGAQPNVSPSEIGSFKFVIPKIRKEQQKIANFFKNLDNQILVEEEKLAKLEKLKQAYLNNMFV